MNTSYFFPLLTKSVLKFCSGCKKLKPLNQFNKYPWNTYFLQPIVSHVNMTKMKNDVFCVDDVIKTFHFPVFFPKKASFTNSND